MKKLNILRSWSGFEGFTPERLPYIGEVEKYPGVYYAVTGSVDTALDQELLQKTIKCMNGEEYFNVKEV